MAAAAKRKVRDEYFLVKEAEIRDQTPEIRFLILHTQEKSMAIFFWRSSRQAISPPRKTGKKRKNN